MPTEELTLSPQPVTSPIDIQEIDQLTPEVIRFLESVRWGTQGVLYHLKDCASTLRKIPPPLLFLLHKHGKLVAMRMVLIKSSQWGGTPLKALYHSMTAVASEEQGKGYGKMVARYGLLRQRELLGPRGLMYAYVEDGNERNLNMLHGLGYTQIGQFYATLFSRLLPQDSPRIGRLPSEEAPQMRKLLDNLYTDHTLTDFDVSLRTQDYWVLMHQGEIVAGVQVDPQRWEILAIPGPGGMFALHWLPKIPFLNSIFNPRDFRFLKFGNLYFQNGHADAAVELLEALLARYQLKTAMMYWDKWSPVYQQLAASGGFGLLNRLAETRVNVLGQFLGFHGHEMEDFNRHPLAISPMDI